MFDLDVKNNSAENPAEFNSLFESTVFPIRGFQYKQTWRGSRR